MIKSVPKLALSALVLLFLGAFADPAYTDTVTLKSGQIHKGEIIAEEEERIQIKLERSGVRLWFSRDQISSYERTEPTAEQKEKESTGNSSTDQLALDDDVARARKMLEKLREEQLKAPPVNNKNKSKANNKSKKPVQQSVATQTVSAADVEAWVNTLRKSGDLYKRRNACIHIGKADATEAIPDLIHALDDKESLVRRAANESLIKMTEQDFGFQPDAKRNVRVSIIEKWEDWYADVTKEEARGQLRSWF